MGNHDEHDHKNHHRMMIEDFKRRFYVTEYSHRSNQCKAIEIY